MHKNQDYAARATQWLEAQPFERSPSEGGIGHRVLDVGVAQVLLHGAQIHALVDQVDAAGVA